MSTAEKARSRYITTPIYYASGLPHAGHLYANFILNILKEHFTQRGEDVRILTGLDEHGEKIERQAKAKNITPQQYVDGLAPQWKQIFSEFGLSYDVFLRTTDAAHKKNVQDILQRCYDNGDIYFGEHEGYYCVQCEAFLTPKEMDENKNCLTHKIPTELRKEGNYYFKLTKYRDELSKLVRAGRIVSQKRYQNELAALLENLEGDLSISRPKTRTTWGIDLPFDEKHVSYVWFDALPNYVTGIGGVDAAKTSPYWANSYHILGKDILKFHGVFWPAMLLSLKLPMPKLLVTGWLLAGSHKMSKSLGNVITTSQLKAIGRDAYVNAVIRVTNPGEDMDLSLALMLERYNSDLANGVGNLLSRTLGMIEKYFEKKIPGIYPEYFSQVEKDIQNLAAELPQKISLAFEEFRLSDVLHDVWVLVGAADKYIADSKPWVLAKDTSEESRKRLANVLSVSIAVLRMVGVLAYPFFPEKMKELLASIGEGSEKPSFEKSSEFLKINIGYSCDVMPRLFDRVDIKLKLDEIAAESPASQKASEPKQKHTLPTEAKAAAGVTSVATGTITIDHFAKTQICVGTVINAEVVEGSDKLLKLQISLGERGVKQIFSGIRQWVKPEEVVNHKVLVLANLEPRKMRFGMSEGMLLSSETADGRIYPVFVPEDFKEGSLLS